MLLAERALLALEGIRGHEWVAVIVSDIDTFGEGKFRIYC